MSFITRDAIVAFIYQLINRHVPAYVIEDIMNDQNAFTITGLSNGWIFDNENLGRYAHNVARQFQLQTDRMTICTDCMNSRISKDQPLYCMKCYRPLCSHCALIVGDEIRCGPCQHGKDDIDALGRSNIIDGE